MPFMVLQNLRTCRCYGPLLHQLLAKVACQSTLRFAPLPRVHRKPTFSVTPIATVKNNTNIITSNQELSDHVVSSHVHSFQVAATSTEVDTGLSDRESEDSSCEGSGLHVEELSQAARHVTRQVRLNFHRTALHWLLASHVH